MSLCSVPANSNAFRVIANSEDLAQILVLAIDHRLADDPRRRHDAVHLGRLPGRNFHVPSFALAR